jgi:SAM-dependent methyltransferase
MNAQQSDYKVNKSYWDARVQTHMFSEFYEMDSFRAGKSSLRETEIKEIGSVEGKKLCHLQCHFGQDTLSWARLGARVCGLDLSPEGIKAARKLAQELNINAEFVEGNVLEAASLMKRTFDIVFTSYGTIIWLHDLDAWANQIASLLGEGGFFYMIDFHPVAWMFDEQLNRVKYSYFNTSKIVEETIGTYADKSANLRHECVTWNHSVSEIINALIGAGLHIDFFNEFGFSWFNVFEELIPRPTEAGGFIHREHGEKIPLMFSLKASKH